MSTHFVVPPEFHGQRLDRFLVSVLADRSRSQLQRLIAEGHVAIATTAGRQKTAKPNLQLRQGDRVTLDAPVPSAAA